jgi:hypothetical protein
MIFAHVMQGMGAGASGALEVAETWCGLGEVVRANPDDAPENSIDEGLCELRKVVWVRGEGKGS